MKKLKLEAIQVTSFETSNVAPAQAGTVRGQQQVVPAPPSFLGPCYPTDPNFDCTFGCSQNTACPERCVRFTDSVECA
ncbi:pinensin family lanthipeptide [Longimicrobium sp.]|uniref:pinensin family lanthipeptide n=1 Tax=Longimicrobium sp. TaxID=2029185 RepID=UPI002CBAAD2E|nr:pinensin family lanthipeptide [Longimicrobium sp.]HSU15590.1 pinensin family lanthipeptide [Longimicrobium sp.]